MKRWILVASDLGTVGLKTFTRVCRASVQKLVVCRRVTVTDRIRCLPKNACHCFSFIRFTKYRSTSTIIMSHYNNNDNNNNNNEGSSSFSQPPEDNPILKAYESFVRGTPYVTRCLVQSQAITWILSWWIDLGLVVGNIPQFTLFHYEIYRLVLSPFICTSFISLLFCFLSFADYGKRMEYAIGSTAFAILLGVIGGIVNLLHLTICLILNEIEGSKEWLFMPCFGIWILIFGLLSIDCFQAPATNTRRLFVFDVPVRYYPFALLVLFSLLGGFQLAYLLAIGVGYAYQQGHLDKVCKVDVTRIQSWERTPAFEGYISQPGWIVNDASGRRGDWNESGEGNGGSSTGGSLFASLLSGRRQPPTTTATSTTIGVPLGTTTSSSIQQEPFFPATGGRALGTTSRRSSPIDPRQARLEALDRRMGTVQEKDDAV